MAKKPVPNPTESELAILQVLWRRGPRTVRQVYEELGGKGSYTTVLKFLQIMLEKGLVRRDDADHSHVYEAAAGEDEIQNRLVTGLIDKAFSGSASRLVMRALSAKTVSPEELKEIQALLTQARKQQS